MKLHSLITLSFASSALGMEHSSLRGDRQSRDLSGKNFRSSRPLDMSEMGETDQDGCEQLLMFVTLPIFHQKLKAGYKHCCGPNPDKIRTNPDGPDCCIFEVVNPNDPTEIDFGLAPLSGKGECPGVWPDGEATFPQEFVPGHLKKVLSKEP